MTLHDASSGHERDMVAVAPGVPTDRVRWAPIWAGVFAALTTFVFLSTLGVAIGLSSYDAGDDARRFALGAGIWGLLSMLLAFGFGGWITGRSSAVRGHGIGLLNGFMVAGVGIPLMLFALGSATGALIGANDRSADVRMSFDNAMTASDRITGNDAMVDKRQTVTTANDDARRAARRGAWGTLLALALAIGASAAAGYIGAGDNRVERESNRYDTAVGRRDTSGTGTTPGL